MTPMYVVGVGPGDPSYLSEKTRALLQQAQCVVGFQTVVDLIRSFSTVAPTIMTYRNQEAVIAELAANGKQDGSTVICCWGDPNVSDKELLNRLRTAGLSFEVVPGTSSMQIACARAQIPMEESLFITFHKRGDIGEDQAELAEALRHGRRHTLVLPRPWDFMPQEIATWLAAQNISPDRVVHCFERLTLPDERRATSTLAALAQNTRSFSDLTILVFEKEEKH